ncbi:MAG: T9SS type A sorting domain-containing protein [bacterium]|nr:T9SS type A sorting domain-containing protein [bacterium]
MKGGFFVCALAVLLMLSAAQAAEFRVEVAYFDLQGGPLTIDENSQAPLPDGCLAQVLLQADSAGKASRPKAEGVEQTERSFPVEARRQMLGDFALNGGARLRTPGFFLSDAQITGRELPPRPLFVRVWNAADSAQASGYWDSPLYDALPGFQQVSFLREEWTYHARERAAAAPDFATAGSSAGASLAERHELLTAGPNPFNSSARISFVVKEAGGVRLQVFDLQGRLTATLVDGPLTAGSHDLVFDGSPLPSGLYFLSLEQEGAAPVVRKLILMR